MAGRAGISVAAVLCLGAAGTGAAVGVAFVGWAATVAALAVLLVRARRDVARLDRALSQTRADLARRSSQLSELVSEELAQRQRLSAKQAELEQQNSALGRANDAKGAFLASMSHELRTPLNAVIGFSELLQEGVAGPVTDAQHGYLDDIRKSGRHLLAIIADILDYSKIEAGKLSLKTERVDLGQAVREAVDMVEGLARKKDVRVTGSMAAGTWVLGDPVRLRQVALNLLSNAIKFTPSGGTIDVGVSRRAEVAELTVKDSGVGIAKDHHELIFEAFRQVDEGSARRHEGTGLGLALVRRILEAMHGHVTVDSELGHGSRFTVTLPLVVGATLQFDAERQADAVDVVIAEDDDAMRFMLSRLFKAQGFDVRPAANGQRAMEALAERLPQVLLLDLMMPELDGYELLERLRRLPGGEAVRVMVFTATVPTPEQREHLARLGATFTLKGSVGTSELAAEVQRLAKPLEPVRRAA